MPTPLPRLPHARLLLLAALAHAGGTIGYLPLLTLLLPIKVEAMAGPDRITLLTATVICGAIAASIANIVFGWLSDRSIAHGHGRRSWIMLGAAGLALAYALLALAETRASVVVAVVLFQCAINAMLAPLFAILAEEIPDAQKGLMAGLMALANPTASGVAALAFALAASDEATRFGLVAAVAIACMAPLALMSAPRSAIARVATSEVRMLRHDLLCAWAARLLVQIAGNVLALYLLYYFESIAPDVAPTMLAAEVGRVLVLAYAVPLPIALLLGHLSDRIGRRKPILLAAAVLMAAGLVGMAIASDRTMATICFGTYAIGTQVFVNLHAAFAMQLLPDPAHRGRDLGVLNLTNTLPALAGPALTWWLATPRDFAPLMLALAVLALAGGLLMLRVRGRR